MKKVLALILATLVIFTNPFALIVSAENTTEVVSDGLVVKTGSDFWINDWNNGRARSITSSRLGLLKTDYYYNCFTRYRSIEVVDEDTYYADYTEPYFILKSKTDISQILTTGTLRFWVNVPKDMSLKIMLMTVNSNGSYGKNYVNVNLKTADKVEGYQKVEIPLSDFVSPGGSWNPQYLKYISIGGISNCTADSFLTEGEILYLSDIEIWSGEAPEPEPFDTTPEYYGKSGNYYVRDINRILSTTTQVAAFKDTLRKESYIETVEQFSKYAALIELYSFNIIDVGDDYGVAKITDYVEIYIPITENTVNKELLVGVVTDQEIVLCDYAVLGNYLSIITNQLGDILILDVASPDFTLATKYYTHSNIAVNDNSRFKNAVSVSTEVNTSGYTSVFAESGSTLPEIGKVISWLNNENGIMRFWVNMPWREGTPVIDLSVGLCVLYKEDGSSIWPDTNTTISVVADGLWHEIRISSSVFRRTAFDSVLKNAETYSNFYFRIRSKTEKDIVFKTEKLYFSPIDFFTVDLSTTEDNGNVERTAFAVAGAKKDYVSDVSVTENSVDNNKFISTAKTITRKETTTDFSEKVLLPYSANVSIAEGETLNQLGDWFYTNNAQMRTYVKNESDSPISFKVGIYGALSYNSSTVYPKVLTKDYITLPANSDWQEIRIKLSETDAYQERIEQFTKGVGYVALEICTKKNEFLQKTGDSLLVAPLEIYSLDIIEAVATEFEVEYSVSGILTEGLINQAENSQDIIKTVSDCDQLPFAEKIINLNASKNYSFGNVDGKSVGILTAQPVFAADFALWAKNPSAEMRFWAKSSNSKSFTLALMTNSEEIKATVNLENTDSWQEIILKRSDFTENTNFDNSFKFADTRHLHMLFYADAETFTLNESISILQRAEFYSDKAYPKGDTNLDAKVDLRDLVRFKRLIANSATEFINGDIDSDCKLSSADLTHLRKWLLNDCWF